MANKFFSAILSDKIFFFNLPVLYQGSYETEGALKKH